MFMKTVPWMDSICINETKGWFIASEENALMYMEMESNIFKFVSQIPQKRNKERDFFGCVKYGDKLICIPYEMTFFLVYLIQERRYIKIIVNNPGNIPLRIACHMEKDGVMYAVSWTMKQMIEIDLIHLKVKKQYTICGKEDLMGPSVFGGSNLYSISLKDNCIFITDFKEYKTSKKNMPINIGKIQRITYHNGRIYLTGNRKEIYIWDCEHEIRIIDDFPEKFGEYNFNPSKKKAILDYMTKEFDHTCFLYEVVVGDKIWFIPFKTNKTLYIDEKTQELQTFELQAEDEDRESLKNRLLESKYLFEYVRENRYLGLYSLKNLCLLEIDSETLEVKYLQIHMNECDYRHYENSRRVFEVYKKCSKANIIVEDYEKMNIKDFLDYLSMK